MDPARPSNPKLITLKQTALLLAVSVDVLLKWNELNILKPTITQTGEVGYTQEQIDNFRLIQQLAQRTPSVPSGPTSKQKHEKISLFWPIASLSLMVLAFATLTQYDKLKLLMTNNDLQDAATQAFKTSEYNLAQSSSSQLAMQLGNRDDSKLTDEGTSQKDTTALTHTIFETKDTSVNNTQEVTPEQVPTAPANNQIANIIGASNISYAESTNFLSKQSCPSCFNGKGKNSVFDTNGNIRGKATNSNLFASFETARMPSDTTGIQAPNTNIFFALVAVSLLPFMMLFKKQPAYSGNKPTTMPSPSPRLVEENDTQTLLEVTQKTDGAVVILFQGKEYKICKPELNSESDQFIERLMELTRNNVKEIEYDITRDDQIRIYAPLSKVVTRLGFVGIKRDLFFPRTSKNSVLFRRYVTKKDILSMNIATDQIPNFF